MKIVKFKDQGIKMKTPIEILKAHQAWRTHKCDSDGVNGCGKVECNMPITTPSELTDALANYVICSACGSVNSIRWEKKEVSIDDKQGSYKDLTFDFCEECGNVTNVDLS